MAPSDRQQKKMLLELVVKCIVPTVCAALQIHFILMVAILLQHQKLKQEADLAIQEKNRALRRYRQLRNRFLRSKRRNWKNPGRTDEWWRNLMDRKMLPEEWNTNFRMSREEAVNKEIDNERRNQDCFHHTAKNKLHVYNSSKGNMVRDAFKKYLKKNL
eukprot:gene2802-3242_t